MKITCLICELASPIVFGIGLPSSGSILLLLMKPLLASTRCIKAESPAAEGTPMILIDPIVANFGEPRLSGSMLLFAPAPQPRALNTYNVCPSALTQTAAGHQPVGMWPSTV